MPNRVQIALVGSLTALAWAAPAHAARIVTWDGPAVSESRFVDPASAPEGYYNEPPGTDPRPNALKADVYLPDGYAAHPERRYPVLCLLHGHGDAYDSWPNPANGDLLETADGFGGIIVMPEGDHGWYTNWWNGGTRGDPAWERYHLDQLIPAAERRFRIRKGRRWHAIAGLSMGGEGSLFYASQRPGYFGSAASFSGAISIDRPEWPTGFDTQGESYADVFGDPQEQRFYTLGHDPTSLIRNLAHTRLYVSVGDGVPNPLSLDEVQNTFGQVAEAELHQHGNDFVAAAGDAGVPVTYDQHQGIHDWPYWRADLANAIDWGLFEPVERDPRDWRYRTVARTGWAWNVWFRFHDAPGVVERFRRSGDKLSVRGEGLLTVGPERGCGPTSQLPFKVDMGALIHATPC